MTEDRARPLAAFALVSLLCAIILGVNLAQGGHTVLVDTRSAHAQLSSSDVVFGKTLTPRAGVQAAASVSAGLSGVGPLNDAVARTSSPPVKTTHKHVKHHKATHQKRPSASHAQPSHGTVKAAPGRAKKRPTAHVHTVRSHQSKSRGHHVKATSHIRHAWGKHHGSRGHRVGYARGHGRGHHGWGHHRH